jgi:hypothetical protein
VALRGSDANLRTPRAARSSGAQASTQAPTAQAPTSADRRPTHRSRSSTRAARSTTEHFEASGVGAASPSGTAPTCATWPSTTTRERKAAVSRRCSQIRQRKTEPLWSPVVATGGNRSQIERGQKPQKQAKNRCRRLRPVADIVRRGLRFESGRGLCKSAAYRRFFVQIDLLLVERAVGMEPLWCKTRS